MKETTFLILIVLFSTAYYTYKFIHYNLLKWFQVLNIFHTYILLGIRDVLYIQSIGWMDVDYLLLGLILVNVIICSYNYYTTNIFNYPKLDLTRVSYYENGKYYEFRMENTESLDISSSVEAMFYTLTTDETFRNFGKYKIVFIKTVCDGEEKALHTNTMLTNTTTFKEYSDKFMVRIGEIYGGNGYNVNMIDGFIVMVWIADPYVNKELKFTKTSKPYHNTGSKTQKRGYHTQSRQINKIKVRNNQVAFPFATMDLETMDFDGVQYPVAISCCDKTFGSKLFMVNKDLLLSNRDEAINIMFKEYFELIKSPDYPKTIFIHNLGSFDGYFLYKYLLLLESENSDNFYKIGSIIDKQHKFIEISLDKIKFRDSYRIFGVSLDKLCDNFGVKGKTSKYNPKFNTIELFNYPKLLKSFMIYSIQDSRSLYQALFSAQNIYFDEYKQDITQVHSTSSLSMKIFRKHFLGDKVIPILKHSEDKFIRKSYFGGATDYYKGYAENVYYYDVNSLYPYAMKKPMPHELISIEDKPTLNGFFGFLEVEVECNDNVTRPVLPVKFQDKTLYPYGKWIGTYFSEELKAVEKLGYIIKPIKGYRFSSINLFDDYIDHFYDIKKKSAGSQRFIAKMHLNQLYGLFGRSLETITTQNVYKDDLPNFLLKELVESVVQITPNIFVLLCKCNSNPEWLKDLGIKIHDSRTDSNSIMFVYNIS